MVVATSADCHTEYENQAMVEDGPNEYHIVNQERLVWSEFEMLISREQPDHQLMLGIPDLQDLKENLSLLPRSWVVF